MHRLEQIFAHISVEPIDIGILRGGSYGKLVQSDCVTSKPKSDRRHKITPRRRLATRIEVLRFHFLPFRPLCLETIEETYREVRPRGSGIEREWKKFALYRGLYNRVEQAKFQW